MSRDHSTEGNAVADVTDEVGERPGGELRAAREAAGLELGEVAERLRLSPPLLRAIEADDYASLPPATFVRGYLRGYARLLGLDGDRLVAAFDEAGRTSSEPRLELPSGEGDGSGRGRRLWLLLLLVVALAAAGAAAWWYTEGSLVTEPPILGDDGANGASGAGGANGAGDDGSAADEQSATGATEGGEALEAVSPETIDAGVESPARVSPNRPVVVDPDLLFPSIELDREQMAERDAEVDEIFEEVPLDGASADAAGGAEPTDPAAADGGVAALEDPGRAVTEAAGSGPDRLALFVEAESWIEVYDDRERRLVYVLYGGDSPLVVNGWAPFEVYLGYAPGVRVEVNGTEVETGDFVRPNETARFIASQDGARQP